MDRDEEILDLKRQIEELKEQNRLIDENKAKLREKKDKLYSTLVRGGISHGVLMIRHQKNTAPHEEANSPYGPYFQPPYKQRGVWHW